MRTLAGRSIVTRRNPPSMRKGTVPSGCGRRSVVSLTPPEMRNPATRRRVRFAVSRAAPPSIGDLPGDGAY